ncbi:MAG: DegT/DnrJ/EryC1/StrS family aminotransferase, partial [Chthoniobacterales bacterium]
TLGDAAAYSLYPTKNLGALGDGGVCLTKDAALAGKLKGLREYGWKERYVSDFAGANSRLDELQASILRVKLKHLDADNNARRRIAARYRSGICNDKLDLPAEQETCWHVYHQFVVRSMRRDELRKHLAEKRIGTLVHYPVPIHLQPAYRSRIPLSPLGLQQTEAAALQIASLPMFPELKDGEAAKVVAALNDWQG